MKTWEGKWISVLDKLPDHDEAVLATDGRYVAEVRFFMGRWITKYTMSNTIAHIVDWDEQKNMRPVSHWMPLPPPPNG